MNLNSKSDYRVRRHMRLRRKVCGSAERPRMCVFVSGRHMYVQFIDDAASRTLASASTQAGELKGGKANVEMAKKLGAAAAAAAKATGIAQVVFDRGGFAYAGRVKALAEAARESGLKF